MRPADEEDLFSYFSARCYSGYGDDKKVVWPSCLVPRTTLPAKIADCIIGADGEHLFSYPSARCTPTSATAAARRCPALRFCNLDVQIWSCRGTAATRLDAVAGEVHLDINVGSQWCCRVIDLVSLWPQGFYALYEALFEKLVQQEVRAAEKRGKCVPEDLSNAPRFGALCQVRMYS